MVKRCQYGDCKSDERYSHSEKMKSVAFHRFPNPKKVLWKCEIWIKACGQDLASLSKFDYSLTPKFVYSIHFVGGKGPTVENPHPLQLDGKVILWNGLRKVVPKTEANDKVAPVFNNSNFQVNGVPCTLAPNSAMHQRPLILMRRKSSMQCEKESKSNFVDCGVSNLTEEEVVVTGIDVVNFSLNPKTHPIIDGADNIGNCTYRPFKKPCLEQSGLAVINHLSHNNSDAKELISLSILKELNSRIFNWTTYYGDEFARFSLEHVDSLIISIFIHKDMSISLRALGHDVSSREILKEFKSRITLKSDLLESLNLLRNFKVCHGNFIKLSPECNIGNGEYNFMTNSYHSNNCKLLISNNIKKKRCDVCKRYGAVLRNKLWRSQYIPKKRKSSLKKKHQVANVKYGKRKAKYFLKKANSLQQKIRQAIRVQGHLVSKKDSAILEGVLQTNVDMEESFSKIFLKEQLNVLKVDNSRARKWHPKIIKWCLSKHSKVDGLLKSRNVLHLPCQKILYNYSLPLTARSGFNPESFHLLQRKMNDLKLFDEEHTMFVMLNLVDIKMKQNLFYKRTTGDMVGFENLEDFENELKNLNIASNSKKQNKVESATNILQLIVKGITSKLKFSLAIFPGDEMKPCNLNLIVWEAIRRLEGMNCRVLVVLGDSTSTNQTFFKNNFSIENKNYQTISHYAFNNFGRDGKRPLYFIFDPSGLIKTARNSLESSTMESNTRVLLRNGKYMLWDHVKRLYYLDCERIPRRYPTLKFAHLMLGSYGKMNLKYAARVLSATIAAGIEEEIGDEASETVQFLRMMYKFFNMVIGTKFADDRQNPDLNMYQFPDDLRLHWLENEFLDYFIKWEKDINSLKGFTKIEKNMMLLSKETLEGLKITTMSVVKVLRYMLSIGAKTVNAGNLNQDSTPEPDFG